MTRRTFAIYTAAAALVFGPGPIFAQENPPETPKSQGARPNPSGGSSGSAVPRPSGGSGGSSGSSVSSGASPMRPSAPAASGSSRPRSYDTPAAPQRRAVPRNESAPRSDAPAVRGGERRRVAPSGATGTNVSPGDSMNDRRRAVPSYARPRDGRPVTGTAIDRRHAPDPRLDPLYVVYNNYYSRFGRGYFWPGYGFGLGLYYDPLVWGYYSPYGYADPYYGGYGGGYGYGYSRHYGDYRPTGAVRLKVKPEFGQVYVDGYYVGEVDQFDGVFQRLKLEEGAHRIEIRAEGYETVQFEVMIIPGETVTYKGTLQQIQ